MVAWLTLAACGGTPPASPDGAAGPIDTRVGDATQGPDGAWVACNDLRFSRSEAEVSSLAVALLEGLRAHGAEGAYYDPAPDGTQRPLSIQALDADIAGSGAADPLETILTWLDSATDGALQADEYAADPALPFDASIPVGEFSVFDLVRNRIDGVPFAAGVDGPAVTIGVRRTSGGWRLTTLAMIPHVVFATDVDARLQEACPTVDPPPASHVLAFTFHGLEMSACVVEGEYDYTPNASDQLVWRAGTRWRGTTRTGADEAVWVPTRELELTVAPENAWPRITHADCYCPSGGRGDAGFTVTAHAVSGMVVAYSPGINCVVC